MARTETIKIGTISERGRPKVEETSHACGGKLVYRQAPYTTGWNTGDQFVTLNIENIWGYFCTNCSVPPIILREVSKVMEKEIDQALNRSPRQSIL